MLLIMIIFYKLSIWSTKYF